jgi:protein tyrosine phosphatase
LSGSIDAVYFEVSEDLFLTMFVCVSFMQGYDNSESFIITQDPLESTVADFWRMVSEQSISTLVMLSDVCIALAHLSECAISSEENLAEN